MGKFNIKNYCR